jgi:hypothetical protein
MLAALQSDGLALFYANHSYTGMVASRGTGDVWSINPLLTQSPASGDYNAQGIELDFNNNNHHRGEVDAGGGLAAPVSYVLTGVGSGFATVRTREKGGFERPDLLVDLVSRRFFTPTMCRLLGCLWNAGTA